MRVLVLGANGMLGNAVYRLLSGSEGFEVCGAVRSAVSTRALGQHPRAQLLVGVDVESVDQLLSAFAAAKPDVVINCIGLIKQLGNANDPLAALPINAILPHRLQRMAAACGARLVHVSTDCVFSGSKGGYLESDTPDAYDLYGRSKLLGEVTDANAITLRTSIIGHELNNGANGLVGWFLSQSGKVKGFRKAVFSGLPTVELARVIRDHVLPRPDLNGLWHVSSAPIDKFTLLSLVREAYGKTIDIEPDDKLVIDRSLNSDRFRKSFGYTPAPWPDLVASMRAFG